MKKSIQLLLSVLILACIILASLEFMPSAKDQIPVIKSNYSIVIK